MKKLALLVLLVCLANNLVFWFFHLPRFWGMYYERFHFYQAHAANYNTLFIGSSVMRYSVNPALFDSVNAQNGLNTKSFDLGVDGGCPTELFSTYKYILSHKSPALKYVFVELTLIDNFDMGQLHTLRRKSSFDISQYIHAVPLTLQSNYTWDSKAHFLFFDLCHVIENTFKIDMFHDALEFRHKRKGLESITTVDDHVAMSVDDTAQLNATGLKRSNQHQMFLSGQLPQLKANTETAATMFTDTTFLAHAHVDGAYVSMVQQMLSLARQKGVTPIFILPPRFSKENYQDLLPVYYSIPAANRIQLADANQYPEFYMIKYSYDIKHVNQYGVPLFTNALANGFLKLAKQ